MRIWRFLLFSFLWTAAVSGLAADEPVDFAAGRKFWSFQPLKRQSVPQVEHADWIKTPVDGFILAKLETARLSPSRQADRGTLIRRAWFDLLGLPPEPDDVQRWMNDGSADWYGRMIDQFLASPRYGERWARYWLDLARYTDTTASWLKSTGSAWLYRDWVVRAFNEDVPYDDFVRRQLATDMMPATGPEDSPALGYLGLSPTYWKELKLDKEVIKVVVAEEWEERIDALSRTFLGLTVACARCHDHKFDPVSMNDYYAIAGVFASIRLTDRALIAEPAATVAREAHVRVKSLEAEIKKLQAKKPVPEEQAKRITELKAEIDQLKRTTPFYDSPLANGVDEASLHVLADGPDKTKLEYKPGEPRNLHMHLRGNPADPGKVVPRRFLRVLSTDSSKVFQQGSGRLELANAIVGDAAPLAARVFVNRIWRHHFGRGLVDTPSNFGTLGARPSHPKLLDDLAARFIEHGWSIKWLHRQIMNSAAYRQDSTYNAENFAVDPGNKLLWRMSRRRLDIEAWRDAMLAVSGNLQAQLGGPAVELADSNNHRRTIYAKINRRDLNGMLRLYDFPDPTAHSPGRETTTTPLQQLFVLNGPFIQRQSAALVQRLKQDTGNGIEQRIQRAYQLLFARPATKSDVRRGTAYLDGDGNDETVWRQYVQVLLGSNEFMFMD